MELQFKVWGWLEPSYPSYGHVSHDSVYDERAPSVFRKQHRLFLSLCRPTVVLYRIFSLTCSVKLKVIKMTYLERKTRTKFQEVTKYNWSCRRKADVVDGYTRFDSSLSSSDKTRPMQSPLAAGARSTGCQIVYNQPQKLCRPVYLSRNGESNIDRSNQSNK